MRGRRSDDGDEDNDDEEKRSEEGLRHYNTMNGKLYSMLWIWMARKR